MRENHTPVADAVPVAPFPGELLHLREIVSHHLIPLALLARSDGEFTAGEHGVIVDHCIGHARSEGMEVGGDDIVIFAEYVSDYRPTLVQLDPALQRLARSTHLEVTKLVDAAHAVVDADGAVRPEEKRFLLDLSEALLDLSPA